MLFSENCFIERLELVKVSTCLKIEIDDYDRHDYKGPKNKQSSI